MNKKIAVFLSLVISIGCQSAGKKDSASELTKDQKQLIYETSFEVIIEKPTKDSLTYEKPLPWDLIPYNIRIDKYYSIGTAFAVSDTELLSAFHVLNMSEQSLMYTKFFVRDKNSVVYEIDTVKAFDSHRDFVKFTVKNKRFTKWMKIKTSYELNETVFTVGNAYGEGIIIRKGDLIGTYPEPESNKFILLRSSSDVNPGNSGGPLLDRECNVIGVVVSRKDNISFSIPISEVQKSKPGAGIFHSKLKFGFYLIPETSDMIPFDLEIPLPQKHGEIIRQYRERYMAFYIKNMEDLFKKNSAELFPQGESSLLPLNDCTQSIMPEVVYKDKDSMKWHISSLKYTNSKLKNNGKINFTSVGRMMFIDVSKPDDVPLKSLLDDPKVSMKLILEGMNIPRAIGNEKIRILSLGPPVKTSQHIDNYRRKWRQCTWIIEYSDEAVLSFSTPTPQGMAVILAFCETSDIDFWNYDMKKFLDFIQISYFGKFKEFVELLNFKDALPEKFSSIKFSFQKDKAFSLSTNRFNINLDNDILNISDDTLLTLSFGFFNENKKTVWDMRRILVSENQKKNYFALFKELKPDSRLPENYSKSWDTLIKSEHPFTNKPYMDDGLSNTLLPTSPIWMTDFRTSGRSIQNMIT